MYNIYVYIYIDIYTPIHVHVDVCAYRIHIYICIHKRLPQRWTEHETLTWVFVLVLILV